MADYQAAFKKFKLKAILDENPGSDQFVVTITTNASGTVTAAIIQSKEDADARTSGTTKTGCPYPPGC